MAARWTGHYATSVLVFRAEKRSAQASAHLLSQAQCGLFCLLTAFVSFCESSDWDWMKFTRCERFLVKRFYFVVVFSSLEKYFEFRTTNISVKTDHSVSLRWNKTFLNISKEVCIFLLIVRSICELSFVPVLRILSPGWIKTRLYSVISSYGYFFYTPRFIYLWRTSFILVFSQITVMLTRASE